MSARHPQGLKTYAEQQNKVCTVCKKEKPLIDFYLVKNRTGSVRRSPCKQCKSELCRKYFEENRFEIVERRRPYQKKWQDRQPKERGQRINQSRKEYFMRYHRRKRADKLKATPPWVTKEHFLQMRTFYLNRPVGYHVDHIIPLKGKAVRGLHVPWNLQYLPAKENMRKGNRIE
jgi:hypothetical protein